MQKRIFLNSLPKSGTNLVAKCLDLLGYRQSGSIDANLVLGKSVMSLLRRWVSRTGYAQNYLVGIDMPVEVPCWAVERILTHAKAGEYIPGHVGYTADLLNRIKTRGYSPILVLRDPRAVLNSFVHYVVANPDHPMHKFFQDKTDEERYRFALYGVTGETINLQPLLQRCQAMDIWVSDPAVLTLRFEDLVGPSGGGGKEDQEHSLAALVSFLGIEGLCIPDIAKNVFGSGRHTFRKGSIHGWIDEIPAVFQHEVKEVLRDVLVGWGYEKN
jgi:hypothetical protein